MSQGGGGGGFSDIARNSMVLENYPALLVVHVKLGGSTLTDWYIDTVGKNHFNTFSPCPRGYSDIARNSMVKENTQPWWWFV